MKLASSRSLSELKPVLMDQNNPPNGGSDPVYEVYTEIEEPGWVNRTILKTGRLDQEYAKTFGHYHTAQVIETYKVEKGQGVMILQKKHFENEKWIPEIVDEVYLVKASAGDEIIITPEYGHSWSNIGQEDLQLIDTWAQGHQTADYVEIEKHQGMAYYLVEKDGKPEAIPNINYLDLPEPKWLTAQEFADRVQP